MKVLLFSLFCFQLLSFQLWAGQQDSSVIIGLGSSTIDLLVQVDDSFIKSYVAERRGGSNDTTPGHVDGVLAKTMLTPKIVPGGSAANTMRALAKMGHSTAFMGEVGKDEWGSIFCDNLKEYGVDLRMKEALFTARVLCLISPDGQRTFLGFNPKMEGPGPSKDDFAGGGWLHLEARHLKNQAYVEKTLEMAKELRIKISIDLSSFADVLEYKEVLLQLILNYAEIVFCNEDEIEALTGLGPYEGCLRLQEMCPIGVITLGEQGCLIGSQGVVMPISSFPAKAVDTTGAGDHFAAGFLYGYLRGQPLDKCGRIGNRLGGAIIEVIGAQLPQEKWQAVYDYVGSL